MLEQPSRGDEYCAVVDRVSVLVREFEALPYPQLRDKAAELLQSLDALHRHPLERLMSVLQKEGSEGLVKRLEEDPIIRQLFLLYDLISCDERTQVESALYSFFPYVQAHGGDIEVLAAEDGAVRIRLAGACQGCDKSTTDLRQSIEEVLRREVPGFRSLEVDETHAVPSGGRGDPADGCAECQ